MHSFIDQRKDHIEYLRSCTGKLIDEEKTLTTGIIELLVLIAISGRLINRKPCLRNVRCLFLTVYLDVFRECKIVRRLIREGFDNKVIIFTVREAVKN